MLWFLGMKITWHVSSILQACCSVSTCVCVWVPLLLTHIYPRAQVLLLSWCDNLDFGKDYQLVEIFSGCGRLSQHWCAPVLFSQTYDLSTKPVSRFRMTVLLWLNYREYQWIIKQNLSRHEQGFRVASIDRDYSSRSMDFLKTSGYLFLG